MGYNLFPDSWDVVNQLTEVMNNYTSVTIWDQKIVWGVDWEGTQNTPLYAQGTNAAAIQSTGSGLDLIMTCIKLNGGEVPMSSMTWLFDQTGPLEANDWTHTTLAIGWWYYGTEPYCYLQIAAPGTMTSGSFESGFNNLAATLSNRLGVHGFNPLNITDEDRYIFTAYFCTCSVFEDSTRHATTPESSVKVWQLGCCYNTYRATEIKEFLTNTGDLVPQNPLDPDSPILKLPKIESDPEDSALYYYPMGHVVGWRFPSTLSYDINDFYDDDIDPGQIGGDGDFSIGSDGTGINGLPTKGILESGMCKLYIPETTDLQAFARELWQNAQAITAAFGGMVTSPIDAVINLGLLPVNLTAYQGAAQQLQLGSYTMDTTMPPATQEYIELDMGSMSLPAKWNSALDYSPYSKYMLYLPYIGYVDIPPEDIVPDGVEKILSVFYKIHLFTGDFVCQVTATKGSLTNMIEQFAGNMMMKIPVTAMDYSAYYKNQHDLGVSAIGNFAAGNIFGGIVDSIAFAAGAANPAGQVKRSGNFDGSTARMSYYKVYLIRTSPNQVYQRDKPGMSGFEQYVGFPCYKVLTLSPKMGFCKVNDIILSGFDGMDEEMQELRSILKEGVYL